MAVSCPKKFGSIVLMDVLGTKARWNKKNKDKQEIFEDWEQFLSIIEKVRDNINEIRNKKPNPTIFPMNVHSFSDTILLTFPIPIVPIDENTGKPEKKYMIENILFASDIAGNIISLGLAANLPFRGCISFGEFYENKRTVTGDAIIDAASYYEKPQWIGVSLSTSAYKIMKNNPDRNMVNCSIPLDKGIERKGLALNLVKFYDEIYKKKDTLVEIYHDSKSLIKKMNLEETPEIILDKMLDPNKDTNASFKIKNTIYFLNDCKNSYNPNPSFNTV